MEHTDPVENLTDHGTVVFMRSGEMDSDSQNDIWDDTALIKAYDKAIKQAQQTDGNLKLMKHKKKKQKKRNKAAAQQSKWSVGDNCEAKYSEDKQVYEAVITEFLDDERCIVQYVDYGNEEEQQIKDLKPNLTKNIEPKNRHSRSSSVSVSCSECSGHSTHAKNNRSSKISAPMAMPSFIPPPPPSLPDLPPCDTDEAFHSMLISWYMSGYHTGYYQGLKDAANH